MCKEYLAFADAVDDKPISHLAFEILYWCGLREGELLALTVGDVDFARGDVSVTKTLSKAGESWAPAPPKTPRSVRRVSAPRVHLESRGHVGQIAKKFGISESEVPRLLRNIIRDGRIVSNEIRKTNGREGYERIYEYNNERILLTGIGLNGFMASAYPLKSREAK